MRIKKLEKRRNKFVVQYYKFRKLKNKTLTKKDIANELSMFFIFYTDSSIYTILKGY